jgi:hypothetical protein
VEQLRRVSPGSGSEPISFAYSFIQSVARPEPQPYTDSIPITDPNQRTNTYAYACTIPKTNANADASYLASADLSEPNHDNAL